MINHSDAKWLAVAGEKQLGNLGTDLDLKTIYGFHVDSDRRFPDLKSFDELLKPKEDDTSYLDTSVSPDTICLNMYTSGTMGVPKCVQLMHKNILSQQAALDIVWDVNKNDRFLAYLPWHHSFGGIFELFTALYNGSNIFSRKQLR